MSGDYSRFTHDAAKRFSSVYTQQGRVALDADWNEAADMVRRRFRTQALDTFGPLGVPFATTPDGFRITAPTAGDFVIGKGRIYADGLLAEIFPGEDLTYKTQPFLPDPPALTGTSYAVYLDLWEREVTYIEDGELIDKALGGVDTATRLQQVWQVRALATPAGGAAACGATVGTPPSGGRLSVVAIAPPAPEDPCVVPPLTGYRGLENRLYRVEIQTPGPLGTARFKWSRDNGSLVTSVGEMAVVLGKSQLRVGRVGRDRIERFAVGDWVSVTDDHRELHGEAGDMAQIEDIDEATALLKLNLTLAAATRAFGADPAALAARHTRVQKWDQRSGEPGVGTEGTIATGAGPIAVEDGIELRFSTTGAEGFHTGDYWLFAARTADASVEGFTDAAPRGIVHTYAQLAAVNGPNVADCRPQPVEGEGCCTFVLAPGDDIQQAIDSLPPEGGCVCLKTGTHELREPLIIAARDVSFHGESSGAIIHIPEGPLLTVSGVRNHIHDLQFRRDRGGPAMFTFVRATDCAIEDCELTSVAPNGGIGIALVEAGSIGVNRCNLTGIELGVHLKGLNTRFTTLEDCTMMPTLKETGDAFVGVAGVLFEAGVSRARIAGCTIAGFPNGIAMLDKEIDLPLQHVAVVDNLILCRPARAALGPRHLGIGLVVDDGTIAGNRIYMEQAAGFPPATGIAAGGSRLLIAGNGVTFSDRGAEDMPSVGLHFGWNGEAGKLPTDSGTVRDNKIRNAFAGLFVEDVTSSTIGDNTCENDSSRQQSGSAGLVALRSRDCRLVGNSSTGARFGLIAHSGTGNSFSDNHLQFGLAGLLIRRETAARIAGNSINGFEQLGIGALAARRDLTVCDNRVDWIGTPTNEFPKLGICLLGIEGLADVSRNLVSNVGFDAERKLSPGLALGIVVLLAAEARAQHNAVGYDGGWEGLLSQRDLDQEDRALLLQGMGQPGEQRTDLTIGYPCMVEGNRLAGAGRSALIEFLENSSDRPHRFERVSVTNNDCMHLIGRNNRTGVTAALRGRSALVSANHFRGLEGRPRCVDFGPVANRIFVANFFVERWVPPGAIVSPMADLNVHI